MGRQAYPTEPIAISRTRAQAPVPATSCGTENGGVLQLFHNSVRVRDKMSDSATPSPIPQPAEEKLRVIRSEELLQGEQTILIDHYGTIYKLRITKQGKLILNKP
jgi:hemin uptake protein HemP